MGNRGSVRGFVARICDDDSATAIDVEANGLYVTFERTGREQLHVRVTVDAKARQGCAVGIETVDGHGAVIGRPHHDGVVCEHAQRAAVGAGHVAVGSERRIERAVVVGTSFGGLMALALATFRPGVLAGLVLNDIGPSVGWQAVDGLLKAFSDEQPLSDWNEAASELKRIIPELGFKDDDLWLHAAKATWREGSDGRLRMDFDARLARVWRNRGVGEHDLWSLWTAARVIPTLSLRGQISGVLTVETVAKMKATKPDLRTATVPSVGHAPSLIEPESHAALTALLADVDALESQRERRIA